MLKNNDFKINENLYVLFDNKETEFLTAIEFFVAESSTEVIINGKIMNINEIEKWIFFKLISELLNNNSVSTEELLKPFKSLKSKVPVKKQLQKSIHNLRNQIPEFLSIDKEKKHEVILTKRKTQFTDDTTYSFYVPEFEVKSFIKDSSNLKNILFFCKKLIIFNNENYLEEIMKGLDKIVQLIREKYKFYLPLLEKLENILNSYDLFGHNTNERFKVIVKMIEDLENNFISNNSELLNNPLYKISKPYLGFYYGYNFATSGEDKISQSVQKIYIDKNNNLKSKQISSEFKYFGNIKIDDNCLFTYAELIGEKGFVQEVLNKPIVATTELRFLLGSFTAFSVDRKLCFGKRILVKIDNLINPEDYRTGYINQQSKEQLSIYFNECFDNINQQVIKVKLPHKLEPDIKNIKTERGKTIDIDWLNNDD